VVRSPQLQSAHGFELLLAHPSFDVWGLGCILFQILSEDAAPLWQCGQDDNLTADPDRQDSLFALAEWSDSLKAQRLQSIKDPLARNLVSLMLVRDAAKRAPLSRVAAHPYLSGKHVARLPGTEARFDVFLSYRSGAAS